MLKMQPFVTSTPVDLEITILSVESLSMPNKAKKNSVSVFICMDSDESTCQTTSTVDVAKGDTSATWNERVKVLEVNMYHTKRISFEVRYCKKSMLTGWSKSVAICKADVLVLDLVEGQLVSDCVRFLSYRLRDRDGEDCGIVNFSIRVKGLERRLPELGVPRWHGGGGCVVGVPAAWCL